MSYITFCSINFAFINFFCQRPRFSVISGPTLQTTSCHVIYITEWDAIPYLMLAGVARVNKTCRPCVLQRTTVHLFNTLFSANNANSCNIHGKVIKACEICVSINGHFISDTQLSQASLFEESGFTFPQTQLFINKGYYGLKSKNAVCCLIMIVFFLSPYVLDLFVTVNTALILLQGGGRGIVSIFK